MNNTNIGDRVEKALNDYISEDITSALLNIFPILDLTAKKEYGGGVGSRIKSFLRKNEALISYISTGLVFKLPTFINLSHDKPKKERFEDVIYNKIRNNIVHEGTVNEMISFHNKNDLFISPDRWGLNNNHVLAFILCVILSEKNSDEFIKNNPDIKLRFGTFKINDLWGKRESFIEFIVFSDRGLKYEDFN